MMDRKIEKKFSREEFAEYLETLAGEIRSGKLSSTERGTVPGELGAKIRFKEKKGRVELKINCRWSTLTDYNERERKQIADWHNSMKAVKKKMGSSFKQITKAAEAGNFPDKVSVDDFVKTSRVFVESAEPEWKDAMDEYMDHLENFILAVEKGQLEVMLHEVRDLQYRMKACHKEFK